MHSALSLPEILAHILSNLSPSDLASSATVCKRFWEEATPLLWEDVCLADCAQLLPAVSVSEIATERLGIGGISINVRGQRPTDKPRCHINVKRDLEESDWAKLDTRAPLVKHLRIQASVNHSELYPILKGRESTGGSLFRNLRSLQVEEVEQCHKQCEFIPIFASPTVRKLDIRQSRHDSVLAESVLAWVPGSFPSLTSLTVHLPSYTMASAERVLGAVKSYSSLTNLEVRTTPQELAQVALVASQMESLVEATFFGVGTVNVDIPAEAFKPLQVLRLEGRGMEGIRRIVSSVSSPSLRELDITWLPETTTTSQADYLPHLSRFEELKILRLNAPEAMPLASCITPALDCQGLEVVSLRGKSSDYTKHLLQKIGRSWPSLRHVALAGAGPDLREAPYLGTLRCFAEHCPHLESISSRVRFDFSDPLFTRKPVPGLGTFLRSVDVGRSPITLPLDLPGVPGAIELMWRISAEELLKSWPNLTAIEYDRKGSSADYWNAFQSALLT
ncbi:hypothetical protein FRB90_011401, partial [Tulasnella sp. 427]